MIKVIGEAGTGMFHVSSILIMNIGFRTLDIHMAVEIGVLRVINTNSTYGFICGNSQGLNTTLLSIVLLLLCYC